MTHRYRDSGYSLRYIETRGGTQIKRLGEGNSVIQRLVVLNQSFGTSSGPRHRDRGLRERLRDIETQSLETQRYRISEGSLRDIDTQGQGETQRYEDSSGKNSEIQRFGEQVTQVCKYRDGDSERATQRGNSETEIQKRRLRAMAPCVQTQRYSLGMTQIYTKFRERLRAIEFGGEIHIQRLK